jgi:hypothetical protein
MVYCWDVLSSMHIVAATTHVDVVRSLIICYAAGVYKWIGICVSFEAGSRVSTVPVPVGFFV